MILIIGISVLVWLLGYLLGKSFVYKETQNFVTEVKTQKVVKEVFEPNVVSTITLTFDDIVNIKKDLKQFEEKHKTDSKLFYDKFEKGKLGDEDDYIIWAGIYEMFLRDKQKLAKLQW